MDATQGESNMGQLDRVLGRVETIFNLVAAYSIVFLMLLGVSQIFLRTVGYPMWGYIDFVEQSIAVFAFMGIAYCQRQGSHVRMELIIDRLTGRPRYVLELLATLAALFLVLVLIRYSFDHFLRAWRFGDSTIDAELPVWPSKLVVPLALSLLAVRLFLEAAGFIRLVRNPQAVAIAVPLVEKEAWQAEIEESRND